MPTYTVKYHFKLPFQLIKYHFQHLSQSKMLLNAKMHTNLKFYEKVLMRRVYEIKDISEGLGCKVQGQCEVR